MSKRQPKSNRSDVASASPANVPAPTPAQLPRRRPLLLVVSSVLIVGWIVFLAVMAFRN
jgi:hypothetical protein